MIIIPENIEALLFDCDGTLADTMELHWEAYQKAFHDLGISCSRDFIEHNWGLATKEVINSYNRKYSKNINADRFSKAKEAYAKKLIRKAKPITPITSIVTSNLGRLPLAMVSSGTLENILLTLKTIDLEGCFDVLVTSDDSLESKPSPRGYLYAAEKLNIPPNRCLVFEDSKVGILAAKQAGMEVLDIAKYLSKK